MTKSTDTYEHTINGLLQKRKEVMEEMVVMRERLGAWRTTWTRGACCKRLSRRKAGIRERIAARSLIVFYRGQISRSGY